MFWGVSSMFWAIFVDGVVFWVVSSMFWAGFVDGSGVLRQVLGLGFGCVWRGAILKNRGVGFVGDCCYLCIIYILSVVCLGVRDSVKVYAGDLCGNRWRGW